MKVAIGVRMKKVRFMVQQLSSPLSINQGMVKNYQVKQHEQKGPSSFDMFMTREEMAELTDYKLPKPQIEWLAANGIPFVLGGSGYPKVLSETVKKLLGDTSGCKTEPTLNLGGLKRHATRQKRTPNARRNATKARKVLLGCAEIEA